MCSYTSESNGMLRGGLRIAPKTVARIPAAKLPTPIRVRTFCNQTTQAKMHPWAKRLAIGGTIVGVGTIATRTAVNWEDKRGETPLIRAVDAGDIEKVRLLIACGADINHEHKHGHTALILAIWRENNKLVELLLDRGADIGYVNKNGETALIAVVSHRSRQINNLLSRFDAVIRGMDVFFLDEGKYYSFLEKAYRESEEIIKLLLDRGANIYHADKNGKTALDYASNEYIRQLLTNHKK
jgi:ankyrin repeat protein